jgi:addiction module RelE/StbE family toxin
MAREIIHSEQSLRDRRNILSYWRQRNMSDNYSRKLNQLFKEAFNLVSKYPEIGKITTDGKFRVKVVRDYLIIYEVHPLEIVILSIWDARNDPRKLANILP